MDPRLLKYYNRELAHLREMGGEFASEFPKIAGRLSLDGFECADPYVERLLEGFAFLAARLQMRMDAEFPRFTQHLFEMVYPHYCCPTPSLAVVQMQPDLKEGALAAGFVVPRYSSLKGALGKGETTACEFRTAHAVTLYPLELVEAQYFGRDSAGVELPDVAGLKAAIRIRLKSTAGMPLNKLKLDRLPLFIRGMGERPMQIYEQVMAGCVGVALRPAKRPPAWQMVLPRRSVRSVGFDEEQALLPYGARSFQGYRLLAEYFACPQRFMFVELTDLAGAVSKSTEQTLDVILLLDRYDPQLEAQVEAGTFALFCTPAVNLFPRTADRIHLTDHAHEHHVVATSSTDGDVKLWSVDPASQDYGRVIHRMVRPHAVRGIPAAVNFVAFGPQETTDEATLLTAGDDGVARLWKVANQSVNPLLVLSGHRGRVRSAIFSPGGQLIITAGEDRTARLWDAETGQPAPIAGGLLNHPEMVLFATFSPAGDLVISGCDDNNAYVWNLNSDKAGTPLFTLQGHTAAVTSGAISPDGRRAVTGSHDGIAKLWDLETGREILSLKRHAAELTSVHFAPDGRSILTSSLDRSALLWPAVSIGPSLKLSAARVEIPREAGLHLIDPYAKVLDPDAGNLTGGTLRAWLKSRPTSLQSATLDLSPGSGLQMQGDQVLINTAGQQHAVARIIRTTQPASALELKLLPDIESHHAQSLLRRIALRTTAPLDSSLTINFQLTDGQGLISNLAEVEVQSTDEAASPAIARSAD